jgi:protoheme IX farnesyltransferase
VIEHAAAPAPELVRQHSRWRDYVALGKPLITLLLLATTWAGMVVAGGRLPPWPLVFWTLLGGGLTAAGASALNQYIDRDLDARMSRTRERPLPGGRLTPNRLCASAWAHSPGAPDPGSFVNVLSAALAAIGGVHVCAYSLYLKRDAQNIVIGGAASDSTVVGWAAVADR